MYIDNMVKVITIPKELSKRGDLVLMPREEYEELKRSSGDVVSEKEILKWSKEAKELKKSGKLPKLRSFADLEK